MTTAVRPAARPVTRAPAPAGALAGTGRLLRLALRTDRWTIALWALAVAGLTQVTVVGIAELYPTAEQRAAQAALTASPAATAMAGPGFGLDDYTLGAMTANELALWLMVAVAIMGLLAVSRHLRAVEEDGRLEIVRAHPVGRAAPVVAGLLATGLGVLVVGVVTLAALLTTELEPAGSVLMSASVVAAGLVVASATAVLAQLTARARTASALGLAALGVAFVLRAVGDVQAPRSGSVWTWLSPLGWSQATAPWTLDRWWPLAPSVVAVLVNVALAAAFVRRRDIGTGLLPERRGRAHGRLRGLPGLAWRRGRTSAFSWGAGVVGTAVLVGVLADAVVDFVADQPDLSAFVGQADDVVAAVLALYTVFLAVLASAYVGTAVAAARADERTGRAALLLSLPVPRVRRVGAHVVLAAVGATVMMLLAGLVMGVGSALVLDDGTQVGRLLSAAAVTVPGVLVVLGVAVTVDGWAPRAGAVVWAYVAYLGLVGMFGPLLPDGSDTLSPFAHLPAMPAEPFALGPVVAVTAVAVALVATGLAGARRRDVDG